MKQKGIVMFTIVVLLLLKNNENNNSLKTNINIVNIINEDEMDR